MPRLQRRDGIVWIQPRVVRFPMIDPETKGHVMAVHTLAGFEKILGYKDFTQEQLREIFWDNREDFEPWPACCMRHTKASS